MKFRLHCTILPICGLFVLPLLAQDQGQLPQPDLGTPAATPPAPPTSSAPLQIQDSPSATPSPSPVPSLFAPEAQPNAPQPSGSPTNTATPADATSTAPSSNSAGVAPSSNNPSNSATTGPSPVPASNDQLTPPPDSGMGSPGQNPPPSDPNSLIPSPVEPEQISPINTAGNEEKQRQEQKARYYIVKVRADKDDDLAALLQKGDNSKTDEAKRQTLRVYYDLLAKRMKKIDPSLSDWIDTMHAAYLRRIDQVRLEPTIPINPPPSPDASPSNSTELKQNGSSDDSAPVPTHHKRRKKVAGNPDSTPSPTPKNQAKSSAE